MFSNSVPVELANISYERVALLLNLASLLSQMGVAEARISPESIKAALKCFIVCLSPFHPFRLPS